MIKLYQFSPIWNLPNPSPFCIKLETYLRLAKIPYETITGYNLKKAPKNKMPYINDNGKIIGDSSFIITYLKKQYGDPLDSQLTATQKALALSIQRLVEDHLYWVGMYSRWVDPVGWTVAKPAFFGRLSSILQLFVPRMIQKKITKALYNQGIGRHTTEEIYQLGQDDVQALANLLTDQAFFMGQQVSSIDAIVWGFLTCILNTPCESPLKKYTQSLPNLVGYDHRMKALFDAARPKLAAIK